MDLPFFFCPAKAVSVYRKSLNVKFDEARCPFSTFLRLVITTAHAHKSGVVFHMFPRAFKQKN